MSDENEDIKILSFYLDNIENYFYIDDEFIKEKYKSNSDLAEFLSSLEVDSGQTNKQITESIRRALKELFNFSSKGDLRNSNVITDLFNMLDFDL